MDTNTVRVQQLIERCVAIGMRLTNELVATRNRVGLLELHSITMDLFDQCAAMIADKPDYIQWRERFIRCNLYSPMLDLDPTGEMRTVVLDLISCDLAEHYFTTVVPVMSFDREVFALQREALDVSYKTVLEGMALENRAKFRAVG